MAHVLQLKNYCTVIGIAKIINFSLVSYGKLIIVGAPKFRHIVVIT